MAHESTIKGQGFPLEAREAIFAYERGAVQKEDDGQ
jgi:hypothetical protein